MILGCTHPGLIGQIWRTFKTVAPWIPVMALVHTSAIRERFLRVMENGHKRDWGYVTLIAKW